MMTTEEYQDLVASVATGKDIKNEDARELLIAVQRIDILMFVFQQALELSSVKALDLMDSIGMKVMAASGVKPQNGMAKRVRGIVTEAVEELDMHIQDYVTSAIMQAAQETGMPIEDLLGIDVSDLEQAEA